MIYRIVLITYRITYRYSLICSSSVFEKKCNVRQSGHFSSDIPASKSEIEDFR